MQVDMNGGSLRLIKIYLSFLLAFSSGAAWAQAECANLLTETLSPQQVQSLKEAQAIDYQVVVMSGEVAGKKRTVALLGEFHLKNKASKRAGQSVVNEFPLRGVEGLSIKTVWGGKAFAWAVRFSYNLYRAAFFFTRNETSTVDDVYRTQSLHAEAQRLNDLLLQGHLSKADLSGMTVEVDKKPISATQVFEELGLEPGTDTRIPQYINVLLERDHQPDIHEQLQTLFIPTHFSACIAAACGQMAGWFFPENVLTSTSSNVAWATTIFMFGQAYSAQLLKRWWKGHPVFEKTFALNYGLINGRNQTMVRNIRDAFVEHHEQARMLVVVGKAHLEGMCDILRETYGFKEEPF